MSGIVDFVLLLVKTSYGMQKKTEETLSMLIESNLLGPGLHTKVYVRIVSLQILQKNLLPPLPPLQSAGL